jgi:hypothetical protein
MSLWEQSELGARATIFNAVCGVEYTYNNSVGNNNMTINVTISVIHIDFI